jgi:hypothetical protein
MAVLLGAGGPCYQWTPKVKGRTVSVALSHEQNQWLKEAIENRKKGWEILKLMTNAITQPPGSL